MRKCLANGLGVLVLLLTVFVAYPARAADTTVILPKGLVIETHLLEEMNSSKVHSGDPFQFVVAKAVVVDNYTLISTGAKGSGHITDVVAAGSSGKSGGITLVYDYVVADDGTHIAVLHDTTATRKNASTAGGTIGGSVMGAELFGVGGSVLGGWFGNKAVHGQNAVIPVTTITEIATQSDNALTLNNRAFLQATDSPSAAALSPSPAPSPTP